MLKTNIKIAWRNLLKNKLFSGINIAGLTLGSTCFLLITLYVYSQFNYDQHHAAQSDMYRVETTLVNNGEPFVACSVSPPIVPMIQHDFPEVIKSSRVVGNMGNTQYMFKWKEKTFYETKGYYVDSTFFQMFDHAWLEGKPEYALQKPFTIVLTKDVKEKMFGNLPALGEVIELNSDNGRHNFTVDGVVDPTVYKSHIRPNFYMALNSGGLGEYVRTNTTWVGNNFIYGYIELHAGTDPKKLESKLPDFLQKHSGTQLKETGMEKTLSLQLVPDIHLHSTRGYQLDVTGNLSFLYILMLIAGFILLIACVNFMNLSTAKSLKRSIEVGIRKTIGANRASIARQFYTESFLVAGISFLLAIFLTLFFITSTSNFISEKIRLDDTYSPLVFLSMTGVYILIALIAGSYPALYLSSFKPVAVIKGLFKKGKAQDKIRQSLVVFQFVISIGMILGSIIIINQLNYMQNQDLGFDKEQKIIIPFRTSDAAEQLTPFKNEITQLSAINSAAGAMTYPSQFMLRDYAAYTAGSDMDHAHNIKQILGDEDYLKALGIPILHGRNLSPSDTSQQILINQTALRTYKINADEAVGQRLFSGNGEDITSFEIIGVVKDFHQKTLKEPIRPMFFQYYPTEHNQSLVINTSTTDNKQLLASLQSSWEKLIPSTPFEYQFLDDVFAKQYQEEERLATVINLFTFIAIFISCLGLFGFSVFIAEQRTKEIGIRKVLGASTISLMYLLSKGFIKLICVALIIAIPLSWYFMNGWLDGFAYRIDIKWWVFAIAAILALGLGLLTVGVNSLKAALANPVESIKTE